MASIVLASIDIDASMQDVWDYVMDPAHYRDWVTIVDAVSNVGRGPLIDTDALVAEVRSGRLRTALDVTDPEPLPEDHPLWSLPGALVVPHVGGASSAMAPRIARLVRRQI